MNYKEIDPALFGLSSRQKLLEIDNNSIAISKLRKSRIIMKDAKQILEIADKIKEKEPNLKISLLISGPICSKSVKFINDNNIHIINNK